VSQRYGLDDLANVCEGAALQHHYAGCGYFWLAQLNVEILVQKKHYDFTTTE
jgi:hypothetical protein